MKEDRLKPDLLLLLFLSCILPISSAFSSHGLTDAEAGYIRRRQLLTYRDELGERGENVTVDPTFVFPNPRLRDAYIALQAWKLAIFSDPLNLTANWVGPGVCNYTGVYCAPLPSDPHLTVVAGIDLNHGDIAGYLPNELGLLSDLALLHINSNRFCGIVPRTFVRLRLLFELDLSNNRFAGKFPDVVLHLPSLGYLDLRYNEFEGGVPKALFDKDLDAIFINNNRFVFDIPENLGNSPVSVVVFANNWFPAASQSPCLSDPEHLDRHPSPAAHACHASQESLAATPPPFPRCKIPYFFFLSRGQRARRRCLSPPASFPPVQNCISPPLPPPPDSPEES